MMKKFLLSMLLVASTVIGSQFIGTSAASAQDIWAAETSNGYEVYVISESVHGNSGNIFCRTKYVYNGQLAYTKNFEFASKGNRWYEIVNNHGTYITPGTVAYNIMSVAAEYL